ncbi:hypothetical protein [Syntrophorhabdus aromaticivorans]|uniref:Uncharacterized protein n=1 Tax=Syntrophorhabdus aromaticivorans TaxID=328301 RepID=A0A971M5I2_9BACT|nr:hypothetical protein [Syntrophorhabdus aromaticivorans]NLW36195.1 hypothetical protein [Syntrophorhabdus aromaticivorans]
MRQVKFSLALLLALFVLVGTAYAGGGGGGYRGHQGSKGFGRERSGPSHPPGKHREHEGKDYRGGKGRWRPGSSYPSGKPGEYRRKSGLGKDISLGGDREGYDLAVPTEACREFLDETEDLRRAFEGKRSAHFKSRYDPATSPEEVVHHQAEIRELWRNIEAKNTENCRWVR